MSEHDAIDHDEEAPSWLRQKGEPKKWYERFDQYYRPLPASKRTLEEAHRRAARDEGLTAERPSSQWYVRAKEWRWEERATAWDDMRREKRHKEEEEILGAAHWNYIQALAAAIEKAAKKLGNEELATSREAIQALGTAGRLLRLELGEATDRIEQTGEVSVELAGKSVQAAVEAVKRYEEETFGGATGTEDE